MASHNWSAVLEGRGEPSARRAVRADPRTLLKQE
jgi:hypothetical protein